MKTENHWVTSYCSRGINKKEIISLITYNRWNILCSKFFLFRPFAWHEYMTYVRGAYFKSDNNLTVAKLNCKWSKYANNETMEIN